MRGRTIQQKPVVGTVEELRDILESLEVHGASVNRIVVATPADRLQRRSLEILSEIENSSDVIVQFLSERLGFEGVSQKESGASGQARVAPVRNVIPAHYTNSGRRSLRLEKRIADVLGAALLVFALTPVTILVAFIVGLDVGFPLIFWQQRPGLGGRPFKLYKFRTMRAAHDKHRVRIPDEQRSSVIGQILRRTRLDELPQLYNVLIGDMSLIGPRPLLPCDQAPEYAARLSVRPGITGWAQVNGGRVISTSDKLILDVWYVQNASLVLDLSIIFRTVKMVLFGDRINTDAVNEARAALV
jgi:lipopolysaccharide/colanic/teichoic acid biosynthesis glycosyltransferase